MSLVIDKSNFTKEVLESSKPVLIDFWAPWCGPCRAAAPVVDELSAELNDVVVGKINVDDEGELAQQFAVSSIPTFMLFVGGKAIARQVGFGGKDALMKMLGK